MLSAGAVSITTNNGARVAIIGAGIIGLSCAWELSKRGADVTLYEKTWPPNGASWAAAGMLGPAYEAAAETGAHPRLFELCMESAALWPDFAAQLEVASGMEVGFHAGPTLAVAVNTKDEKKLQTLADTLERHDVHCEQMSSFVQGTTPFLSDRLLTGVFLPTDGRVDNRGVLVALVKIAPSPARLNVQVYPGAYDHVLYTHGWMSDFCEPVKGQMIALARGQDDPDYTLRGGSVYIVPKADRIVIGATSEMGVTDTDTHEADLQALLARAIEICPPLEGRTVLERWAGVRPVTRDAAPVLFGAGDGIWHAAGHSRNGILLAPVTATIMADMILEGKVSALAAAFSPNRFSNAAG